MLSLFNHASKWRITPYLALCIAAVALPVSFALFGLADAFGSIGTWLLLASFGVLIAGLCVPVYRFAFPEAPVRRTGAAAVPCAWVVRLPCPEPGQCPVCGMTDLDELAQEDMDFGACVRVVPYGIHYAHWDCAELVPVRPGAPGTITSRQAPSLSQG